MLSALSPIESAPGIAVLFCLHAPAIWAAMAIQALSLPGPSSASGMVRLPCASCTEQQIFRPRQIQSVELYLLLCNLNQFIFITNIVIRFFCLVILFIYVSFTWFFFLPFLLPFLFYLVIKAYWFPSAKLKSQDFIFIFKTIIILKYFGSLWYKKL